MADWTAELQALVEEANAIAKNLSVDVEVAKVSGLDTVKVTDATVKINYQHDLSRENQLRDGFAIERL